MVGSRASQSMVHPHAKIRECVIHSLASLRVSHAHVLISCFLPCRISRVTLDRTRWLYRRYQSFQFHLNTKETAHQVPLQTSTRFMSLTSCQKKAQSFVGYLLPVNQALFLAVFRRYLGRVLDVHKCTEMGRTNTTR